MAEFIDEIASHLDGTSAAIMTEALTALLHVTESDPSIVLDKNILLKVERCLSSHIVPIMEAAAVLLTNNIASNTDLVLELNSAAIFERTISIIRENTSLINTFMMLLSNVTISEASCEKIFSSESFQSNYVSLIDNFINYNPQAVETDGMTEFSQIDKYQYLGSFICNMTRIVGFRRILLRLDGNYVPGLLTQVRAVIIHTPFLLCFIRFCYILNL